MGKDKLTIYKNNPVDNFLTIDFGRDSKAQVLIMSIHGKVIYSSTALKTIEVVNASKWSSGLYIVKVVCEKETISYKLVKQ